MRGTSDRTAAYGCDHFVSAGARARISLAALTRNLAEARRRAPHSRVMAAVKGNAYGHGLLAAARAFDAADALAVARLSEARALREAGIDKPLTWLSGPCTADERREAADLGCDIVVHTASQLPLLDQGPAAVVWLKVDTGMHRLGFDPADVPRHVKRLRAAGGVRELRLMTHLACADDAADPLNERQHGTFRKLVDNFDGAVSIASSAALFQPPGRLEAVKPETRGDTWVRPGIALYGVSPFPAIAARKLGLEPAMEFEAQLVAVKPISAGERVGYGGRWQAQEDTVLGIVAAGYGDGYPRSLPSGTPVLVNDRRVPLAGIISMDLAAVDLGPGARDRVGDGVLLWGDRLPVEEVAAAAGTSPYALITGVMHREPPLIG